MLQSQLKPLYELTGYTNQHRVLFAVWICGMNSECYNSFLFSSFFWHVDECTQQMAFGVKATLQEGKHQDKLVHSDWNLR